MRGGGKGNGYQVITLSAIGEAETPAGGSVCIRWESMSVRARRAMEFAKATVDGRLTLKSRMRRRRAAVDMFAFCWNLLG